MDYSLNNEALGKIFGFAKRMFVPSQSNNFKPKLLYSRFLMFGAVMLMAVKIIWIASYINLPINIFFADITKSAIISLTNQTRQALGLGTLSESKTLNQAAYLKAKDMIEKNYFNHKSPQGITPWYWFGQAGYTYKYAGENLAIGFFDSTEVYNAWLNSPSHKDNIINANYKETGVAVMSGFGGNDTVVVVQLFGSPKPQATVAAKKTVLATPVAAQLKTQTQPSAQEQAVQPAKQMVLSEYTKSFPALKEIGDAKDSLYLRIVNFLSYDSSRYLQGVIYMFWAIAVISLYFSLPLALKKGNRALLARLAIAILILSFAATINKDMAVNIFWHQVII